MFQRNIRRNAQFGWMLSPLCRRRRSSFWRWAAYLFIVNGKFIVIGLLGVLGFAILGAGVVVMRLNARTR
jgi:hypothetical protein